VLPLPLLWSSHDADAISRAESSVAELELIIVVYRLTGIMRLLTTLTTQMYSTLTAHMITRMLDDKFCMP